MQKIVFEKGDRFSYQHGYGMVIGEDGESLFFAGAGGREGRSVFKGQLPDDALPARQVDMPFEVRFAMLAVDIYAKPRELKNGSKQWTGNNLLEMAAFLEQDLHTAERFKPLVVTTPSGELTINLSQWLIVENDVFRVSDSDEPITPPKP